MKTLERIVAVLLIILLVLIGNPFMFWMPSMMLTTVLVVVAALIFVWAGFVLTEKAHDEREEWHRTHSGRAAYLSAAAVLTIALVYQGFTQTTAHPIDLWIPATLAVMVLAKLFARFYADTYR